MIEIEKQGRSPIYDFYGDEEYLDERELNTRCICSNCIEKSKREIGISQAYALNPYYVLIIHRLKMAGLLNFNYKPVCCGCFDEKK